MQRSTQRIAPHWNSRKVDFILIFSNKKRILLPLWDSSEEGNGSLLQMITDNHLGLEAPAKHPALLWVSHTLALYKGVKRQLELLCSQSTKYQIFTFVAVKLFYNAWLYIYFAPLLMLLKWLLLWVLFSPGGFKKGPGTEKNEHLVKVLERCTGASSAVRWLLAIICQSFALF